MFDNKRKFSFKVDGMFVEFDRDKDEYFITFIDGVGNKKRSEIPIEIANLYLESRIYERKHEQIWTRHIEHFDLSNRDIYKISVLREESLEDKVIDKIEKEELKKALNKLPKKEKDRANDYFNSNCTKLIIAKNQGITDRALRKSIHKILNKIKNFLNN